MSTENNTSADEPTVVEDISSGDMAKVPSTQLINAVERSDNVLAEAATEDFDRIFAALSGGNDSSVALEVAYQSPEIELDGVFFMDTGVNVTQTKNLSGKRLSDEILSSTVQENSTLWNRSDLRISSKPTDSPVSRSISRCSGI